MRSRDSQSSSHRPPPYFTPQAPSDEPEEAASEKRRIACTGHLQRLVFNEKGEELRRESLLAELRQRIRDVRQGPDGLLYLLTDGTDPAGREYEAALLRLEPVSR